MEDWFFLKLNGGYRVMIDSRDAELVSEYNWRVEFNRQRYVTIVATQIRGGIRKRYNLARLIMNPPVGKFALLKVRPSQGKTFDFRRSNLFIGSNRDQNQLRPKIKEKSSRTKGVSWCSTRETWIARIKLDGKIYYLGSFDSEALAATAYEKEAEAMFAGYKMLSTQRSQK